MDVGFAGAVTNPDPDSLIQGMMDEQNDLTADYNAKMQVIANDMAWRVHDYVNIIHPGMLEALHEPPVNCEFVTHSLEEFATFGLECQDHLQDILKLQELWEVFDHKMVDFSRVKGVQADSGAVVSVSFDDEKAMLEELRDALDQINTKMLLVAKNNSKFIFLCEKGIALGNQTFDENGIPREAANGIPGTLRTGIIFVSQFPYRLFLDQLKDAVPRVQALREMKLPLARKRLDLLMEQLEQSKKKCDHKDELRVKGDEESTPSKKMRL